MSDQLTVQTEGLVLDEILAAKFGPVRVREIKAVEKTLDLNPGLSSHLILPIGTVIRLPVFAPDDGAGGARVVNLFRRAVT